MLLLLITILGILLRLNVSKKITRKTENNEKIVDIMMLLNYLSNFWGNFEMPSINCETNLILAWSERCILSDTNANEETKLAITDTKLYVSIEMLSTQDNGKLLEQLKSGFKRTINWNKYQSKITRQAVSWYLGYLIDLNFLFYRLRMLTIEQYKQNIFFQL